MREGQAHVTRERLADDLRALGLDKGDVVLVHSSLSSLGWVEGGAETVVDALLDAVGPPGTVLFPALTGTERDGPDHPPSIELATTPCWTGTIPETARRRPEAIRSVHPTHSVSAMGARAAELTARHEDSQTPCDAHSPYVRLIEEGGKVLLLGGVTHESNTTLHALEEMAAVPYHLQDAETDGVVVLPGGERVVVRNRLHLWRWERDFPKIGPYLEKAGASTTGPVGASTSTLVSASGMRNIILPLMLDDPLFLLAQTAREEIQLLSSRTTCARHRPQADNAPKSGDHCFDCLEQ